MCTWCVCLAWCRDADTVWRCMCANVCIWWCVWGVYTCSKVCVRCVRVRTRACRCTSHSFWGLFPAHPSGTRVLLLRSAAWLPPRPASALRLSPLSSPPVFCLISPAQPPLRSHRPVLCLLPAPPPMPSQHTFDIHPRRLPEAAGPCLLLQTPPLVCLRPLCPFGPVSSPSPCPSTGAFSPCRTPTPCVGQDRGAPIAPCVAGGPRRARSRHESGLRKEQVTKVRGTCWERCPAVPGLATAGE